MQTVEGNLRRIIDEKGIKQRHLAEKAGIPEKTLSAMLNGRREIHHYERNITNPCPVTMAKLSRALNVPVSYFFLNL